MISVRCIAGQRLSWGGRFREGSGRHVFRRTAMSDLRAWFSSQLSAIGWSGLEGVHDYLEQIPDDEVRTYLLGLLGETDASKLLIHSYISKRNDARNSPGASSEAPSAKHQFQGRKKGRRARGKADKSETPRPRPSARPGSSVPRSNPEDIRQKIREYRHWRKAVNCTSCGNIEQLIPEDGACSFCNEAIFSMWDGGTAGELEHFQNLSMQDAKNMKPSKSIKTSSKSTTIVVNLAGTPVFPSDMPHAQVQQSEQAKSYPLRPLQNKSLPGGGPRFQPQYSEQLAHVFQTAPLHTLPSSSLLQLECDY